AATPPRRSRPSRHRNTRPRPNTERPSARRRWPWTRRSSRGGRSWNPTRKTSRNRRNSYLPLRQHVVHSAPIAMTRDLVRHFATIGARARVATMRGPVALAIQRDARGELFDSRLPRGTGTAILDARRDERHLVMLVGEGPDRSRFLCGHDERHWFVAA